MIELFFQWLVVTGIIWGILFLITHTPSKPEPYKYRIVEHAPYTLEIQVLEKTTTGYLWWKKKNEKWVIVDISGHPYGHKKRYDNFYYTDPPMAHFRTKTAAERKVNELEGNEVINNLLIKSYN